MFQTNRLSNGGVYLGTGHGYKVDLARLDRVAARITAGLFSHHFGYRIPETHHVEAFSVESLNGMDPQSQQTAIGVIDRVSQTVPHLIGDGVFAYWYQQAVDSELVVSWILTFFLRVSFFCMVVPR
ncbi:MAG: hypothetical protein K1X57_11055 [Gemmataceae bacterium]|nr:hypothetical protein [Gemmataceae bacterium]